MVATTLLLTLVTLGTPPAPSNRTVVSMSRSMGATQHLVVPSGVAVPITHSGLHAASDLFKTPAPTEPASSVALERLPTRHDFVGPAVSEPSGGRPSCSL